MRQPAIKRLKHTEQDKRQPLALERLPRNCWIRAERSSGSQGTEALRGTRLGARKRTAGKSTLRWRRRGIANLSNGFKIAKGKEVERTGGMSRRASLQALPRHLPPNKLNKSHREGWKFRLATKGVSRTRIRNLGYLLYM
jgi:hypothetical protein